MDVFEIVLIAVSVISSAASLAVILTYAYFVKLRSKLHMQLVFYISLCDFIANVGSSLGEPVDGSVACWLQSFFTGFGYTGSLFWTTTVCYVLYSLVFHGTIPLISTKVHIVCWCIPIIVTFLPLVSVTYGRYDGAAGWCYLKSYPNSPVWLLNFWAFETFYLWLFLAIILMFGWGAMIYYRVRVTKSNLAPTIMKAFNKLKWYPVIIIISWAVITFEQLLTYSTSITQSSTAVNYASYMPAVMQGFWSASVFFYKGKDVRRVWYGALSGNTTLDSTHNHLNNHVGPGEALHAATDTHTRDTGQTTDVADTRAATENDEGGDPSDTGERDSQYQTGQSIVYIRNSDTDTGDWDLQSGGDRPSSMSGGSFSQSFGGEYGVQMGHVSSGQIVPLTVARLVTGSLSRARPATSTYSNTIYVDNNPDQMI